VLDVLTAEDVRRQDAACEARGITTETLMGNAGFAVARSARRLLGTTYGKRVVILCGKGNNAGDGLVSGRVLSSWGASVTAVLLLGDDFTGSALAAFERFPGRTAGPDALGLEIARADLIIDAIFGVGLSRDLEGPARDAILALPHPGDRVLSVDVPSGMNADTGLSVGGVCVNARLTVTLGGLKPGLLFSGLVSAGRVEVAEIGVPADLRGGVAHALEIVDAAEQMRSRGAIANKRSVGTVLVVAGSRAMPGAAALVAGASVHSGAGLTTVAAPESVVPVVVSRIPEVTTIPLPETSEGTLDLKGLEQIRPRLAEFHAIAIGPGLSRHPAALEAVRALVAEVSVPVVVDADAIAAFASNPETLRGRGPTVLTPHAGELARLMGITAEEVDSDRLSATRAAADRTGCTVVLKGPGTVIASAGGETYLNTTGGPWLAQGGTGDVLTGIVASMLAQDAKSGGTGGPRVVAAAAFLHGLAGDRVASRVRPHPASASMILEALPELLHEVAG